MIYILVIHKYTNFLVAFNIYLLLNVVLENHDKNRPYILLKSISVVICLINIIKLVVHLKLDFADGEFEKKLVNISKANIVCLALWLIPYGIMMVREIRIIMDKSVISQEQ